MTPINPPKGYANIHPSENPLIAGMVDDLIPFIGRTFVRIGDKWYMIDKNWGDITPEDLNHKSKNFNNLYEKLQGRG